MLAVLGFHRSLTSVVAQWLHKSGLCMGEYLMPPAPSNPEGHYEDMPLVALHDDLLKQQGTSWQFSGDVALSSNMGLDVIQRYVSLRDALHGEHWGVKDPRQCLFLPNWQEVLGERGRYLVVLRHWSASIQSLLKRSSQNLALGLGSSESDGRFWWEPGHAAEVWMAYNEKLLTFLEACPSEQRLVVTQQSLMHGLRLPQCVSERFNIPLDVNTPTPIKTSLVHDEVTESVQSHLTGEQVERMSALWERLVDYAHYRADQEEPTWKPDTYSLRDRKFSHSILSASPFDEKSLSQAREGVTPKVNGSSAPEGSFRALSVRAQEEYRTLRLMDAERRTREAMALNPDDAPGYVRLASIMLVSGKGEEADVLLKAAIERVGQVVPLLHFRAIVLDLLERTQEAVDLLGDVEGKSELLDHRRIAFLLKYDSTAGRASLRVWSKQRSCSMEAWQKVGDSLKTVQSQPLREDFALRMAKIWNDLA